MILVIWVYWVCALSYCVFIFHFVQRRKSLGSEIGYDFFFLVFCFNISSLRCSQLNCIHLVSCFPPIVSNNREWLSQETKAKT